MKKLMTIFKTGIIFLILTFPCLVFAVDVSFNETGVITSKRWKSGVPLGGIGCGKIELLTDGALGNFSINHNWDRQKGFTKGAFFAVYANNGAKKIAKVLRKGTNEYENVHRIATTKYLGRFPTAHIDFEDDELPINVTLDAFSPLIPHNIKDSSLPAAVFTFTVRNTSKNIVNAAILFSMENLLGWGGDTKKKWLSRSGNKQQVFDSAGFSGLLFTTNQSYESNRQNVVGQYLIGAEKQRGVQVSYCQNWDAKADTVPFWDRFSLSGTAENIQNKALYPAGAISAKIELKPGEERKLNFIFVWYMPYHITVSAQNIVKDNGHFYMNYFDGPGSIAEYIFKERQRLLFETKEWQNLVFESNFPQWLKLKLVNCAFPMFTNTVLTKDGKFAMLESPKDMKGALGTMDQRMASHAFLIQLFPELDMNELESFARCQQANGEITHLNGNVQEVIGSPNVFYGITAWSDLSCSWIMQVLKLYRWTGNRDFLNKMYPRIKKALVFLKKTDLDHDFIPEGGSTYDYESLPRGSFIYSASCYLGALRSGMEAARAMDDTAALQIYEEDFNKTQKSIIKNMWETSYFIKWYNPKTGNKNSNSFIAQFAGDWMSRLCGTGRTMPADKTKTAVRYLLDTHLKPFFPIPPMEINPEGRSTSNGVYLLQDEPYLGMEAIYEGFVDEGLEIIYRVYYAGWIKNKSPWDQSLCYDLKGTQGGLGWYMTNPTTWHVLNALSGSTLDIDQGILNIHPRLPSTLKELHMPILFSNFWCWLDYIPSNKKFTIKILKVFTDKPMVISKIIPNEDEPPVKLKKSFEIKKDMTIDLSGYWNWKKYEHN